MEVVNRQVILMIPLEEWQQLQQMVRDVCQHLHEKSAIHQNTGVRSPYITAKEFMAAVRICRSNFDKLANTNKIMTLKKGRKVYVVATEVERYFREVNP